MRIEKVKNIDEIRADFPILKTKVYGKPLVYFDNGATTHKPLAVIEALNNSYTQFNSNVHRGVHALSDKASEEYENARSKVREFINAKENSEIIFTSGTTGSINAVAFSFGERFIKKGDEVIVSNLEHHSNIVPWQMVCQRKGATLRVIPVNDNGEISTDGFSKLLTSKTRIVAIAQVSNALGVRVPVEEITGIAHQAGVPVLVDGAQGVQHGLTDVQKIDCDFYAFSGHKIYGPTGIGILYGKQKWLEEIPPYQGGGDMVENVTFEKTTYNQPPFRFEAGTTNFTAAIGLGAALDYLNETGRSWISEYEEELRAYATSKLREIDELKIYGDVPSKIAILSFIIKNVHQYDAGMVLDKMGIAVRTGTHCAQPLMDRLGVSGTIRASMCFYNTKEEIDSLAEGIKKVILMFR